MRTLSDTCVRKTVICQLHKAGWRLSAGVGVLCKLLETGCRLYVGVCNM